MISLLLSLLLAAPAAAQQIGNLAEPQYQLTGKDYSKEAPAIQKMFYNIAGAVNKQINFNATIPATVNGAVNAATVTVNFPLSGTGAPSNPVSLTGAIPPVNVSLATVTTALATKAGNGANGDITSFTALTSPFESGVRQPTVNIDLSTVTTALANKLDKAAIPPVYVDLSTVTTALANKLDKAAIPPVYVDLSTVTTALAGKQASFVGITSACAAGFYLSTGTYANGVVTGGGCVAVVNGTNGSPGSSPGWVVDDLTANVSESTRSFNLSQAPSSSSSVFVYKNGLQQALWTDYLIASGSPWVVTMNVAPPSNTTSFRIGYTINTTTVSAVAVLNATQTFTGGLYATNNFPAVTTLTSGTGATYSTLANCQQLYIEMVASGGSAAGATANAGSNGNATMFFDVVASSGLAGLGNCNASLQAGPVGGSGGADGSGQNIVRQQGSPGGPASNGNATIGGWGGGSMLGPGAPASNANAAGANAPANSGGGGAGGYATCAGAGGSGGEGVRFTLGPPLASSYIYTVGASVNGASAGGQAGGNSGSGKIIVTCRYR